MKRDGRSSCSIRGKYFLAAVLFMASFLFIPSSATAAGKGTEDQFEASNAYAFFCGKRGDLTAPQCTVLFGEYSMQGNKGHVFVCSTNDKVFGCVSGLCEELTTFVSRIETDYPINKYTKLCDLLCGPCKTGWK
jgi:hypothetical protein